MPLPIILLTGLDGPIMFCNISLYFALLAVSNSFSALFAAIAVAVEAALLSTTIGEISFLLRLAICLSIAGTLADRPAAAKDPTAPKTGFAMRSLCSATYFPIFFNAGIAVLRNCFDKFFITLVRESTNPRPELYIFYLKIHAHTHYY